MALPLHSRTDEQHAQSKRRHIWTRFNGNSPPRDARNVTPFTNGSTERSGGMSTHGQARPHYIWACHPPRIVRTCLSR
jgi:hypothetical protein